MPTRPQSHIVGDRAVEQVGTIITNIGWAWERVQKDYGEDLHIQPFFDNVAEPFRLWLQVKGTEDLASLRGRRRQMYTFRFPLGHLLKWTTSSDLVIPVLWDVGQKFGCYCLPSELGSAWDIAMSRRKTLPIEFPVEQRLTENALEKVGWYARLRYYDARIGQHLAVLRESVSPEAWRQHAHKEMLLAAVECLTKLRVFDREVKFCEAFNRLPEIAKRIEGGHGSLSEEQLRSGETYESMAALLVILSMIEDQSGGGCPSNLVQVLPEVARRALAYSATNARP